MRNFAPGARFLWSVLVVGAAGGCRFEDAAAPSPVPDDAALIVPDGVATGGAAGGGGAGSGTGGLAGTGGSTSLGGGTGAAPGGDDGAGGALPGSGGAAAGGSGGTASGAGGTVAGGGGTGAGGGGCTTPVIAVCNPITNEGCSAELGQQCAIDIAASVPQGYCTFAAPMDGPCFTSGVTESCPATTTCTATGECRPVCFCDSDCPDDLCCVDPVGTQGFGTCGACGT